MAVEFTIKEEGGSVFDLPLSVRAIMYRDIMDILDDETGELDEEGNYPGYQSDSLPIVYVISEDNISCFLYIVGEDHKYNGDVIGMNLDRHSLDRLVEE